MLAPQDLPLLPLRLPLFVPSSTSPIANLALLNHHQIHRIWCLSSNAVRQQLLASPGTRHRARSATRATRRQLPPSPAQRAFRWVPLPSRSAVQPARAACPTDCCRADPRVTARSKRHLIARLLLHASASEEQLSPHPSTPCKFSIVPAASRDFFVARKFDHPKVADHSASSAPCCSTIALPHLTFAHHSL